MSSLRASTRHPLSASLLWAVCATGCAITGPPWPAPPEPDPDGCPTPEVIVVEGQPRGALMRLRLPAADPRPTCQVTPDSFALLRQTVTADGEPGEFEPQTVFTRDDGISERLWSEGEMVFLDGPLEDGVTYRYAALVQAEGVVGEPSWPVRVSWLPAPTAPGEIDADPVGRHVHLTWRAPEARTGALVFRREVGVSGWRRVSGVLGPGAAEFVDSGVQPGAIYGYMVSAVAFDGATPIFGPPSAEVVVEATPPAAP